MIGKERQENVMEQLKEAEMRASECAEGSAEQAFMEGYLYAIQILKESMPKRGEKSE